MSKIEILAPVGNEEMLRAAVFSGADAVYLGFSGFNARTSANNFNADTLKDAVAFCHARGVAVHVALNTTVYGGELPALEQAIRAVAASGADAVICQDLAVATLIGKIAPQLPRHGSTQMSVHTLQGALELKELGFTRVVLARELSLPEVEHITKHCGIETECFIHGALCMSVSGQCYMSAFLGGRSGNRGSCAGPCRLPFEANTLPEGKPGRLHHLSLKDNSPSRAEDVLNMLITVYNEEAVKDKNQVAVNTADFINERLIIISRELGGVETELEDFKRTNLVVDLGATTGITMGDAQKYGTEALELETQLRLAGYIKEYLTDPSKETGLIPSNTGISDMNIENQISLYNAAKLKRDRLLGESSESNPVVLELNNSLRSMRQGIIRAVDNLIVSLEVKRHDASARERRAQGRVLSIPRKEREMLSIERQQKIKESLYLYLLNKREENELTQRMTESNARIIDPAAGSNAPVAPKSMMILLASIVLGCAIPAGVLWLLAVSDTKVRSRKDVEGVLSVPFLGEIPMRDKKDKSEVVVHENGRDSVSEAFRIVRTNMDFMRVKDKKMQVVMFTSFNPGAGKTFVSMNLAMSFALTHKKVVLVDLDIRKGTLSSHVRVSDKGVTNYLSGRIDNVDEIIRQNELCDKLDIIHAGPVPPNPAELLLGDRLETLIAELRKRYDYIILDNVPAGVVADAVIVNRVADLTIYVVRAGRMDRRALPEVEKLYQEGKLRNMSLILNGTVYKHGAYGYRYGYGYGYSYGYGYGYGQHKK